MYYFNRSICLQLTHNSFWNQKLSRVLLPKEQSGAIFSVKLCFCFTFADDFLDISWRNVSKVSSWGSGIRMLFDIVDMSVSLEGFSQDIAARVPRWHGSAAALAYREFKSSKNAAFFKAVKYVINDFARSRIFPSWNCNWFFIIMECFYYVWCVPCCAPGKTLQSILQIYK